MLVQLLCSLVAVVPAPHSIPPAAGETYQIDDQITYQTVLGFGASAAYYLDALPNDPVLRKKVYDLAFRDTGNALMRVRIPPALEWNNDDSDPNSLGIAALFDPDDTVLNKFNWNHPEVQLLVQTIREAQKRGVSYFWGACWSPPPWMKTNENPSNPTQGGFITPGLEPEFAEFLTAFVVGMRSKFGITIHGVSPFNEPKILLGESTTTNPSQFVASFVPVAKRLRNLGLDTFVMGPDTADINGSTDLGAISGGYLAALTADTEAKSYLGAVITHSYGGPCDCSPNSWTLLKQATPPGVPIMQTEMALLPSSLSSNANDGIGGAMELAGWINTAMSVGNTSGWHYWSHWWPPSEVPENSPNYGGEGLLIANAHSLKVPKRYHAFKQWSAHLPIDSVRVKAFGGHTLRVEAYKQPVGDRKQLVAIVMNPNLNDQSLTLLFPSKPTGPIARWNTSATKNHEFQSIAAPPGTQLTIAVPAQSIATLEVPYGMSTSVGLEAIATRSMLGPNDDLQLTLNYLAPSPPVEVATLVGLVKTDDPGGYLLSPNWDGSITFHSQFLLSGNLTETITVPSAAIPEGRYLAIGLLIDPSTSAIIGGISMQQVIKGN